MFLKTTPLFRALVDKFEGYIYCGHELTRGRFVEVTGTSGGPRKEGNDDEGMKKLGAGSKYMCTTTIKRKFEVIFFFYSNVNT